MYLHQKSYWQWNAAPTVVLSPTFHCPRCHRNFAILPTWNNGCHALPVAAQLHRQMAALRVCIGMALRLCCMILHFTALSQSLKESSQWLLFKSVQQVAGSWRRELLNRTPGCENNIRLRCSWQWLSRFIYNVQTVLQGPFNLLTANTFYQKQCQTILKF